MTDIARRTLFQFSTLAACCLATVAAIFGGFSGVESADDRSAVDPKWLEQLDPLDRALLNQNIGHAPPEMTDELERHGLEASDWEALRGRVVVIQSWTTKTSAGRIAPLRTGRALQRFSGDVTLIALHTPEGAENAERFLENRELPMPVVVDPDGRFCDELGVYRRPVNIVIDRNGAVRYAGLNPGGLVRAVAALVDEPFDESKTPQPRPKPQEDAADAPDFPDPQEPVTHATDIRGRRAPAMFVQNWLTGVPDAAGKVVLVDFWATWCGPCRRAIPHLNQLQARYPDELVVVGISDESPSTVAKFARTTPMNYAVATDQTGRMKKAIGVRGIPHVIVMSGDWVVRWQGNPLGGNLDEAMAQIIEANRARRSAGGDARRYRWTRG